MASRCANLDYPEDADIDMNLVGTETGQIIEVQGTGEGGPFDREQLNQLLDLGQAGIAHLVDLQNQVIDLGSNHESKQ